MRVLRVERRGDQNPCERADVNHETNRESVSSRVLHNGNNVIMRTTISVVEPSRCMKGGSTSANCQSADKVVRERENSSIEVSLSRHGSTFQSVWYTGLPNSKPIFNVHQFSCRSRSSVHHPNNAIKRSLDHSKVMAFFSAIHVCGHVNQMEADKVNPLTWSVPVASRNYNGCRIPCLTTLRDLPYLNSHGTT